MKMKLRYRLFLRRKSVYYAFDDTTKTFTSLKTKDKAEANRLLMAMNEAGKQPAMNLSLARVYLRHSDPMVSVRTWQNVLEEIIGIKTGPTQARWKSAAKDKAFVPLLPRILIETQAEHLLAVLRAGTVSTNAFLRKVHNFAVDMNWLPATVIPRRQWPAIHYKEKRAITLEEHQKIIAAEVNPERKTLYQLCWHLGASQGDIANLKGEDVDWTNNTVSFVRKKTGVPVVVHSLSAAAHTQPPCRDQVRGAMAPRLEVGDVDVTSNFDPASVCSSGRKLEPDRHAWSPVQPPVYPTSLSRLFDTALPWLFDRSHGPRAPALK